MTAQDVSAQRVEFHKLHHSGCFLIPNPWDIGTARYLRGLGYEAIATTSAGFAFSHGMPDGAVPLEAMLAHIAEIVSATDLPVNADFESGYASEPNDVARNVQSCVATGVAGLSIEDATGNPDQPLYNLGVAVDRIKAARAAIDASGAGVLLTARAECFLVSHPDPLRESVRRLQVYAEAGADVLYAPGPTKRDDIRAIVSAVAPKPVNVLLSSNTGLSVAELAELGVRRISVGSAFARAAWTGFIRAARELAEQGTTSALDGTTPYAELNKFFEHDYKSRS